MNDYLILLLIFIYIWCICISLSRYISLSLYIPSAFSREALARGLAVVVVGYPATPIITSRVRFCISASHTRSDLNLVLEKVSEIGDILGMKVSARKYVEPAIDYADLKSD